MCTKPTSGLSEESVGACLLMEFKRPFDPLNHDDYIQTISYRHELRQHMNKPIKVLVMGGGRSADFPN